ncbi:hypothetical protein GQ600_10551 [Phytophthora cactorum]|nr:hypothetical protein GQ600_10551 [Phytophthora cactorum]
MKANGSLGSKDWDSITPSSPFNGRNDIPNEEKGKGYALRAPHGQGTVDFRRRGNSEGPTSRVYSLATPLVAMPPPKLGMDRKLVSEKCVMMAKPPKKRVRRPRARWRDEGHAAVGACTCRATEMTFCREELVKGWKLLRPPFYQPNLDSFDRRLRFFERSVQLLAAAIKQCKTKLLSAEALAACRYIQLWTRRLLAKVRYISLTQERVLCQLTILTLTARILHEGDQAVVSPPRHRVRHVRFDHWHSKMTARRADQSITLEYPRSDKNWDSFS